MKAFLRNLRRGSAEGVTLPELMIALFVSVFVLAGITSAFLSQAGEYRRGRDQIEMHQTAAVTTARLMREVRNAGYGLPLQASALTSWITWVPNTTNSVRVINGAAGAPDRLLLAGAFGPPAGALNSATAGGTTTLTLQTGQGANFDNVRRKLIYIDRQELARITSVAGNVLTISRHPSLGGRGLYYPHPAGAPIELVQVVEYACNSAMTNALRRPYLYRNNHQGILTNTLQQLTATGIEDLQVSIVSNRVQLSVTTVAARKESGYVHPVRGDAYRRLNVTAVATPRNPAK